jgi:hypothetical protein
MNDPTPAACEKRHDKPCGDKPQTPRQLDLLDHGLNATQTRAIAAAASLTKAPTRRELIADYVHSQGTTGATRQQISDALDLPIQSVCGPVLSMLVSGRLIETDRKRDTSNGKPAAVIVCRPETHQVSAGAQ